MTPPNETRIIGHILARLSQIPGCAVIKPDGGYEGDPNAVALFWRQNTGAARSGSRLIRFGVPGQADITGIVRGRRIEIEGKTDDGRQSQAQRTFQARVSQCGAVYLVVRSADETEAAVRGLL